MISIQVLNQLYNLGFECIHNRLYLADRPLARCTRYKSIHLVDLPVQE